MILGLLGLTTAKWITIGKFAGILGATCLTIAPAVESRNTSAKRHRRTDEEMRADTTGTDRKPASFQHQSNLPLSTAMVMAENTPGVYVLWMNGVAMKCGRASYGSGVAWRLRQYYNLNYDNNARNGEYHSVTKKNRNQVTVSWQCCPVGKCAELEYKLFQKYGRGPWTQRVPAEQENTGWPVLI